MNEREWELFESADNFLPFGAGQLCNTFAAKLGKAVGNFSNFAGRDFGQSSEQAFDQSINGGDVGNEKIADGE